MKYTLLFLSVLLVLSCQQKDDLPGTTEPTSFIVVTGSITNLDVYHLDTLIMGGYHLANGVLQIDVNKDNNPDIILESMVTGSPGSGIIPKTILKSTNENLEVFGNYKTDELWISHDTTFNGIPPNVTSNILISFVCDSISVNSILQFTNQNFIVADLDTGVIISRTALAKCDTFLLSSGNNYFQSNYYTVNDTDYISTTYNENNCKNFLADDFKFIAFRLNANGKSKLGWIKLKIEQNFIVTIESYGIEKSFK